MLNSSYKKFSAKKRIFQKLRDKHKLCIIWISLFAFGYLFDSGEIHTMNIQWTKSLSVNKINSRRMTLPLTNLLSTGGMTCHYPAHLGQSNQDFQKSLKKCRVTRGKSPSLSLGALNINLGEGLHTSKHFQAVPQTLATRGSDKSPQNPSHRMIPQPEFNLWKHFPSWDNLKSPRRLSPTKW